MKRILSLRVLVALLATLAMGLAVIALYLVPPATPTLKTEDIILALDTWQVEWKDVVIPVHSQGLVRARHELPLSLEVSGRVQEVSPLLADGGRVTAGEVLLKLDPEPFALEVTAQ